MVVVGYYFYRLFPSSSEFVGNSHLFDESELMKRVEAYDNMKKITDMHASSSHPVYQG